MKKIYSFVLMAAMLLIGTNAWAQQPVAQIGSTTYLTLQAAVNAVPAGGTATIQLLKNVSLSAPVVIPQVGDSKDDVVSDANKVVNRAMQHITLDLNGKNISAASSYLGSAFILFKGELNITGTGSISRNDASGTWYYSTWGNFAKATIVVCGADGNKNDATNDLSKQVWSVLNIGENVTINGKGDNNKAAGDKEGGFGICIQNFKSESFPADLDASVHKANLGYQTIYGTTHPMWWHNGSNAGAAFGVKVIVAGKIEAYQRGINVLGTVNQSAIKVENANKRISDEYPFYAHNYPYIRIEKGATVECESDGLESGNGGIYAGGWAVIDILGTVKGQTGVLLKGGDAVVDGGTVKSTSTASEAAADANYGGTVSGNAIFIASASNYAGSTNVSIEGGATIDTDVTGGAAIVDKVATNTATASTPTVEHVTIVEGNIDGGISITDGTAGHTTIINATIEDGITITTAGQEPHSATPSEVASMFVEGTTNYTPNVDEPNTLVNLVPNTTTITVVPNTAKNVTLNAFGFATYSFESETTGARRKLPSGVTAYVTTGAVNSNDELVLSPIGDNKDIPAGLGVILVGTGNQECVLSLDTENDPAIIDPEDNKLFAASTYQASYATDENTFIYVLVGSELYKYTGTEMKANKAYLKLSNAATSYGAPQRIKMVFAETQDVENVEVEAVKAVKSIENGQVLIKRGEKVYNVQGQIVK